MNSNQLIIEQVSPFDVPTTVEKLIAAADKKEWQNPANHNLQQSLAKSGKDVRPVQVVEICKADYSGKMKFMTADWKSRLNIKDKTTIFLLSTSCLLR